jgi:hypothetical protein
MKASTDSTNHCGRALQSITSCLGILSIIVMITSCGTSSSGRQVSSSVPYQSGHWFKAQSQPPTYFPKGVPADHPTSASDGVWVMTGDSVGTRYFIPVRGVDTDTLTAEAMSMMTAEKREAVRKGSSDDIDLKGGAARALGAGLAGFASVLLEADQQSGGQLLNKEPRR